MITRIKPIIRWLGDSAASLVIIASIVAALGIGVWLGRSGALRAASASAPGSPGEHEHDIVETETEGVYTCSMHPSVRLTDPDARCPICFMELIPVEEGDAGASGEPQRQRELVMTPAAVALSQIQTEPVRRWFPAAQVRMVGKVSADETRVASIAAWFPGRVERLYVDYTGVRVREGDHLAELYSPDLIAAQEELRQALAAAEQLRSASELMRTTTGAMLESARDKLRLWGLTEEQIARIETTAEPMRTVTLYAPISGVVIHKRAMEGQYLQTGQEIYTVADLSRVWVHLDAYESDLSLLRYGQEVRFTTDALPGETFTGVIAFIPPVLDEASRTVKVRVNVDNEDRRLKPGMFVRGVVEAEVSERGAVVDASLAGAWMCPMHPEEVADHAGSCSICGMDLAPAEDLGYVVDASSAVAPLVIPATAPLITGRRAVVYVQDESAERPTFVGREVTLGPRAGDHYIVREGLREGERVVTNGAFKIDSALQIRAQPSMMSPEGGPSGAGHDHGQQRSAPAPTSAPAPGAPSDANQPSAPPGFVASLAPLYDAYFTAQEALGADALDAFRAGAKAMHAEARRIDASALDDALADRWRDARADLLESAEHIDHLASIEDARALFETYAAAVLRVEERFGHAGETVYYKAHCPMAFNFRGAAWLQRTEVINNPYFGASMLRCGDIQETYHPVDAAEAPR